MSRQVCLPILLLFIIVSGLIVSVAQAEPAIPIPKIGFDITEAKNPKEVALTLQILFLLTILSLVPSILIMFTSFVRVVIVLSFVKRALATQEMPPQQVIVGLALFLTFFIMAPTISTIYSTAVQPYLDGKITAGEGLDKVQSPVREFMFKQTRERDIDLFLNLNKLPRPKNRDDVPTYVLAPSFMISELTTAFQMGILLFIPFIVIDMVVASVLMSMGMIMLPPVMISMPFKILLFVMVDGWHLITRSLVLSFH
ncbi:MAG: flagellar type III secretion system pore protein FliP [bacterium]|nr:flagellar type III secretion system pore protein FliP [bacterium]